MRELAAYVDPLLGIKDAEQRDPTERLPRLYKEDYAILAVLDRVGLVLPGMLRRAVMPGAAERTMRGRLNDKLLRHGLVARWPIVLRDAPRGAVPYVYSLTRYGLQVAQARQPAAVPPSREFREQEAEKDGHVRHDLHMLSWVIELRRLLGAQATEKWRTPRWPAGTCPVPQTGSGRSRRQITLKDVKHAKHIGIFDVDSADVARLEPDATCEIHLAEDGLTFDLIVELDLTDRTAYNVAKFRRYDAFLTAWWGEMRRYQQLGTRPVVVFVCSTPEIAAAYATRRGRDAAGKHRCHRQPRTRALLPGAGAHLLRRRDRHLRRRPGGAHAPRAAAGGPRGARRRAQPVAGPGPAVPGARDPRRAPRQDELTTRSAGAVEPPRAGGGRGAVAGDGPTGLGYARGASSRRVPGSPWMRERPGAGEDGWSASGTVTSRTTTDTPASGRKERRRASGRDGGGATAGA